jgi:hypothetical protein
MFHIYKKHTLGGPLNLDLVWVTGFQVLHLYVFDKVLLVSWIFFNFITSNGLPSYDFHIFKVAKFSNSVKLYTCLYISFFKLYCNFIETLHNWSVPLVLECAYNTSFRIECCWPIYRPLIKKGVFVLPATQKLVQTISMHFQLILSGMSSTKASCAYCSICWPNDLVTVLALL